MFTTHNSLKLPGSEHELVAGKGATSAHESDVWKSDVPSGDERDRQVVAERRCVCDAEVKTFLFTTGLTVGVVDFLQKKIPTEVLKDTSNKTIF